MALRSLISDLKSFDPVRGLADPLLEVGHLLFKGLDIFVDQLVGLLAPVLCGEQAGQQDKG